MMVCENPVIEDLAVKYNVTPRQVIRGWAFARGVILATQSRNEVQHQEALNVRRAESGRSRRRRTDNILFSSQK